METKQRATRFSGRVLLFLCLFSTSVVLGAGQLLGKYSLEIEKPVENIRSSPNGEQIGTLIKGTEVVELDREGKWVHVQVDGWMWGPSLRGFEGAGVEPSVDYSSDQHQDRKAEAGGESSVRPERGNLHRYTAVVAKIVEPDLGDFYGISLDKDLQQLVIRFRVRDISREVLEIRQMRVQREVVDELVDKVKFKAVRIETNRPNGSGEVGIEVAVTTKDNIRKDHDVEQWRGLTRISRDGGKDWE